LFYVLDHELNFETRSFFTTEIDQELDYWKGRVNKVEAFKDIINKKFQKKFDFLQIRYRINKLLTLSSGEAAMDSFNFVGLSKEQKSKGEAFF